MINGLSRISNNCKEIFSPIQIILALFIMYFTKLTLKSYKSTMFLHLVPSYFSCTFLNLLKPDFRSFFFSATSEIRHINYFILSSFLIWDLFYTFSHICVAPRWRELQEEAYQGESGELTYRYKGRSSGMFSCMLLLMFTFYTLWKGIVTCKITQHATAVASFSFKVPTFILSFLVSIFGYV